MIICSHHIFSCILLTTIVFGCKPKNSVHVQDVSVDRFAQVMTNDPKAQLVDVRTPEEYEQGHIQNAINIDFYSDTFQQSLLEKLDKKQAVLVYCKSGKRGSKATKILESLGFHPIYNLLGGFTAWSKAQE